MVLQISPISKHLLSIFGKVLGAFKDINFRSMLLLTLQFCSFLNNYKGASIKYVRNIVRFLHPLPPLSANSLNLPY